MLDATLQGKLAKFVKPGTCDPELDRFAVFVERGAIISGVRWYCVEAEKGGTEMKFKPEGGLTGDHYRRLGTGPLERVQLARAVIENLLKRRGHGLRAIEEAFREVNDENLPGLVEEYSFEAMADALEPTLGKPVPSAPRATSPASVPSSSRDAGNVGERVGEGLGPAIGALADRIESLKLDERLSSIQDDLARLVRRGGPDNPGYLTIEQVASWTNLSDSHVRRAIRGGDLPASNQGSDSNPTWRIALEDVKGWMLRKKGGDRKVVPPKSELDDLIRRHLPGL